MMRANSDCCTAPVTEAGLCTDCFQPCGVELVEVAPKVDRGNGYDAVTAAAEAFVTGHVEGMPAAEVERHNLHQAMADSHPKLQRGQVWCHDCGRTEAVDTATCLRTGWPTCCGSTMSIDAPRERA